MHAQDVDESFSLLVEKSKHVGHITNFELLIADPTNELGLGQELGYLRSGKTMTREEWDCAVRGAYDSQVDPERWLTSFLDGLVKNVQDFRNRQVSSMTRKSGLKGPEMTEARRRKMSLLKLNRPDMNKVKEIMEILDCENRGHLTAHELKTMYCALLKKSEFEISEQHPQLRMMQEESLEKVMSRVYETFSRRQVDEYWTFLYSITSNDDDDDDDNNRFNNRFNNNFNSNNHGIVKSMNTLTLADDDRKKKRAMLLPHGWREAHSKGKSNHRLVESEMQISIGKAADLFLKMSELVIDEESEGSEEILRRPIGKSS